MVILTFMRKSTKPLGEMQELQNKFVFLMNYSAKRYPILKKVLRFGLDIAVIYGGYMVSFILLRKVKRV